MPSDDVLALKSRFAIPGAVSVDAGRGGLVVLEVTTSQARASIFVHGAHVARYRPIDEEQVLFLSDKSRFAAGKAIRGGVPVIFPWFGDHGERSDLPAHGFARQSAWSLERTEQTGDGRVVVELVLRDSERTRSLWPHAFELIHTITVGPTLEMSLSVANTGDRPFRFEEALHTYYRVDDLRRTAISGLAGATYIDKVDAGQRKSQADAWLTPGGETDSVYLRSVASCAIDDPGLGRRIVVDKRGSRSTIVWNPWIVKASRMADLDDEEWRNMVCLESGNVADDAVSLDAGATHEMTVTVRVERLTPAGTVD
jgi:glucose-6-phosphate 1-epimerase